MRFWAALMALAKEACTEAYPLPGTCPSVSRSHGDLLDKRCADSRQVRIHTNLSSESIDSTTSRNFPTHLSVKRGESLNDLGLLSWCQFRINRNRDGLIGRAFRFREITFLMSKIPKTFL